MSNAFNPSGEASSHKLAAVFEDSIRARLAAEKLGESMSLEPGQIDILDSETQRSGRRLLPESKGIWRTWLRAHAIFGVLGAGVGMLAYCALMLAGVGVISANPWISGLVLLHVSTLMGLLIGGLFSLRPDQSPYLYAARDALRAGKAVLLVHAASTGQIDRARQILDQPALETIRTA